MSDSEDTNSDVRERLVNSASRLGVQLDQEELKRWLSAVTTTSEGESIVMDERTGAFGHKMSMLDFNPQDLARFRAIGRIVEFDDIPGQVETALALSGSAAQSKMQTYPGDCDYFERVNIIAPTRAEACSILARILREKALSSMSGPTHQILELKFGSYPQDVTIGESSRRKGSPMTWLPADITAGKVEATDATGKPVTITWDSVSHDPGWCKLDWVVADPIRKQLTNAGNMLDVTWEGPDGVITPLDGYLDGYFQEIYLDATSAPIFNKLVKQMSSDTLGDYVGQLEGEIKKYCGGDHPNFGKAAKRMYNVFRLNGSYEEAAFLRELFDEPTALLYQVYSLIKTVEEAHDKAAVFTLDHILDQTDDLILAVIKVLEGDQEVEIVRHLLRLSRLLARAEHGKPLGVQVDAAQAQILQIVNNFFYEKMTALPKIKEYIDGLSVAGKSA